MGGHPSRTLSQSVDGMQIRPSETESTTGNAARVARHRQRKAAAGVRQVNLMVPEAAHRPLKELARRLRQGEAIEAAMFEVLSGLEQTGTARLLPPLKAGRDSDAPAVKAIAPPSAADGEEVPLLDLSEDSGDALPGSDYPDPDGPDDDSPPKRKRFRLFG